VFRELKASNSNSSYTICTYDGIPVAVALEYGRGKLVVVGDSSLTINEVYYKLGRFYGSNLIFIQALAGGKSIVIYEGARIYAETYSTVLLQAMSAVFNALSDMLVFVMGDQFIYRVLSVLAMVWVINIIIMFKLGLPKNLDMHSGKAALDDGSIELIRDRMSRGVMEWEKKVEEKKKQG